MSILKGTHSGKSEYWKNIIQRKGYILSETKGTIHELKTIYWHYFKYPKTSDKDDGFIYTEKQQLIAYIVCGGLGRYITITDLKHFEMCELYWDEKEKWLDTKSVLFTKKIAKDIWEYEHSE